MKLTGSPGSSRPSAKIRTEHTNSTGSAARVRPNRYFVTIRDPLAACAAQYSRAPRAAEWNPCSCLFEPHLGVVGDRRLGVCEALYVRSRADEDWSEAVKDPGSSLVQALCRVSIQRLSL